MAESLSIISPVFNEEGRIGEFIDRCLAAARTCALDKVELVLVDDGSQDRSREIVATKIREHVGAVKLVELSRNFGQQSAIHAGLSHARGDWVITLDADLQDPPELIPRLMEKMREGFDVVYAQRATQAGRKWGASGHTGVKALGAYLFHSLMTRSATHSIPRDVGEFRCMSRRVVDHLLEFPETMVFLPGLVPYVGFNQGFVEYVRGRRGNRAPTSLRHLSMRALDALTTFSIAPLIGIVILAAVSWLAPLGLLAWIVAGWLGGRTATTASITWLLASLAWCIMFSSLAVIGYYLGRIFLEAKRRPRYFIRRIIDQSKDL